MAKTENAHPLHCIECGSDETEITLIVPPVDGVGGRDAIDYVRRGVLPVDCFDCGTRTWRSAAKIATALRAAVRERLPPDGAFGYETPPGNTGR